MPAQKPGYCDVHFRDSGLAGTIGIGEIRGSLLVDHE